jgi:TRAP-type transport system small permease protein
MNIRGAGMTDHAGIVIRIVIFATEFVSGILVAAITVLLFTSAIFRYFLHIPIGWSDEISRMLFMWVTFLGAALCAFREGHTKFELVTGKLSTKHQKNLEQICSLIMLIVCTCFGYYGFKAISLICYEVFVILDISYIFGYVSLPFSLLLMSGYVFLRLVKSISRSEKV